MSEIQIRQVDYELTQSGYVPVSGSPQLVRGVHAAGPQEVDHDQLVGLMEEANDSYQIREDGAGVPHETFVVNGNKMANGLILKPSTSFSSAFKNPANVLETVFSAAMNPGVAIMYLGSDSNYPSGRLLPEDRKGRSQTGRYTLGDGSDRDPYDATDSMKYLAEMFYDMDRLPSHVMADQEAGRLALGVMTALGRNSVKGAYLNGIDGISPSASYVKASFAEDMKSRKHRRSIGDGHAGELTPVNIKELKRNMPKLYSSFGYIAHIAPLPLFLFPRDVYDKVGHIKATRKHNDLSDLADHAVFQDMSAALTQQEATITMQFNEDSDQHDLEDCGVFSQAVMDSIPENIRSNRRGVRMLLGSGTWTRNTDEPLEAVRMQRLGLPDIRHSFLSMAGGRMSDAEIFALRSIAKAA